MPPSTDNPTVAAPSRNNNPFATCWTKPGALPFLFPAGQSARKLVDAFAASNWRGEIIGPHGSGKSTLLASLNPVLVAAGCDIHKVDLRDGQHRLPRGCTSMAGSESTRRILVIDGYEQLHWRERIRLRLYSRRPGTGLLVTSHTATGLPTLIRLAPDRSLVERLVAALCREASTGITPADVAASHACHGSNVRDILFDLYDRHERWRRAARTYALSGT